MHKSVQFSIRINNIPVVESYRNISGYFSKPFELMQTAWLALTELGISQLVMFGLYKIGVKSGYYKRTMPIPTGKQLSIPAKWSLKTDLLILPDREKQKRFNSADALIKEADEIIRGKVRLFGGTTKDLVLNTEQTSVHWTNVIIGDQDIKFIWEPARFGWAIVLARAYHITQNDDYAKCYWENTLRFLMANPANQGPHWVSAQEVAIRLISLVFAAQFFSQAAYTTPQLMAILSNAIAEHATRIPPTLIYARAQNNNHLISEAAALFTAAAVLPDHPKARHWKKLGWKWLNFAFLHQISTNGTYIQHSTNYHRLMLQLALWAFLVQQKAFSSKPFTSRTLNRLAAATRWLWQLLDQVSGETPHLGPDDGANILPFTQCRHNDYRPIITTAGKAFLCKSLIPAGEWDEMAYWLGLDDSKDQAIDAKAEAIDLTRPPHILRSKDSWGYLRAAQFSSRPGHADQLHFDLWWKGINLAQDPGSYLYTAGKPWDNSLTHTAVHNTLMIDDHEQMHRVGRFLYLKWAQADPVTFTYAGNNSWQQLTTEHHGYKRWGIIHQRAVTVDEHQVWVIKDLVRGPENGKLHKVRLQWLMPTGEYKVAESDLETRIIFKLKTIHGWVTLSITWQDPPVSLSPSTFQWGWVRAGERIAGTGDVHPTWGWTSPIYGDKIPAHSLSVTIKSELPIHLDSQWSFSDYK